MAASPLARSRPTSTRRAPSAASFWAVARPMPEVAPVITQVLPPSAAMSGRRRRGRGDEVLDQPPDAFGYRRERLLVRDARVIGRAIKEPRHAARLVDDQHARRVIPHQRARMEREMALAARQLHVFEAATAAVAHG